MQFQPVFGKAILLGASVCSFLSGCAVTTPVATERLGGPTPMGNGLVREEGSLRGGSLGSPWEDPCSPDWPSACMPGPFAGGPTPLLDCLAHLPHRQELPEAPSYPRFHPLPTRPMFSPPVVAPPLAADEPPTFGALP